MDDRPPGDAAFSTPYLEHHPEQGMVPHRILLSPLPFRIGRCKDAHWVVASPRVSKEHAEIVQVGGEFRVRDLSSTNGTFVNGRRIEAAPLADGDILHLAHTEFMFCCGNSRRCDPVRSAVTIPVNSELPASFIRNRRRLLALLAGQCVSTVFQPVVSLPSREPLGYEALGRGNHSELSTSPAELFQMADECHLAVDLSRTFRQAAAAQVDRLPADAHIFLNTHPSEMKGPQLMDELRRLRKSFSRDQQLVLEIHEHAVADLSTIRDLRARLHDLDVLIAFDDFGTGQSRFRELADAPPDFIKLDRSLISGIDQADARLNVVASLCRIIRDLGVRIIAEGVETSEEDQVCQSLGCHYGQGYLYGRPQPVAGQSHN